jgi:nucleotide-binding universal stress UspA family protein
MTIVVGLAPDGRGRGALHLAGMLARSSGDDVVVCAVIPSPWPPSLARVDAEYRDELERTARDALNQARARAPKDISATFEVHHARSAPAGLLELAEQHEAALIVVSSSSAGIGHVVLGSVSDRLLHSSHVPVALPPRGYRCKPDARVQRVTAAFGGHGEDDLVVAAAAVAAPVGASLRIASFAVRAHPPYTSGVGSDPERTVISEWVEEIQAAGQVALEEVRALPTVPRELETVIGYGRTWDEALEDIEWDDGDVLVVGSSSIGPVARVFLGSRASKIVRHSPVPVVVVPRGRAAELAVEATRGASGA